MVVERLCRRYKKSPQEVLEWGGGWIDIFNAIATFDAKSRSRNQALSKISNRVKK